MKDLVKIKSYPNGIALQLDQTAEFQDILNETASKFADARAFFGSAAVALSITGRDTDDAQEISLLEAIRTNSDLRVMCIVGKDEATNKHFLKALTQLEKKNTREESRVYHGNVCNGEKLTFKKSMIILGNVEEGCSVSSAGSIIVLGALNGGAYAGTSGDVTSYVAALEMSPKQLQIGGFNMTEEKKTRFGKRKKPEARVAIVKDNKIQFENFTKEMLEAF